MSKRTIVGRIERAWSLCLFAAVLLPILCFCMVMQFTMSNDEFPRISMAEFMREMRAHNRMNLWLERNR